MYIYYMGQDISFFDNARARLIEKLKKQGITDSRVLLAITTVPRHLFVDESLQALAYEDQPLPILERQTISQPYIVALMTQTLLQGQNMTKVLEIGTGSGYQAAILASIVDQLYSIERIKILAKFAKIILLETLNIKNVTLKYGDGYLGWEQNAPFDGIIVTAAAPEVPNALLQQLNKKGGRMLIPVGENFFQRLLLIERWEDKFETHFIENVRFVPLLKDLE